MDPRTIGQLIAGFGAKLIVVIVALCVAHEAYTFITDVFTSIDGAMQWPR